MADPVTAGLVISAIAVGVSAAGQAQAANQRRQAASRNRKLLEAQAQAEADAAQVLAVQEVQNAQLADAEAAREAEAQDFRERRQRERQDFIAGEIITNTAAAGLLLEGSPLFVLEENLRQTELGILAERSQSEGLQTSLRAEANERRFAATTTALAGQQRLRLGRFGARIEGFRGTQAFQSGLVGAGGTLLTGGAQVLRQSQRSQGLTTTG